MSTEGINPFKNLVQNGLSGIIEGVTKGADIIIKDFRANPDKVLDHEEKLLQIKNDALAKADELAVKMEEIRADEAKNEDNNVSDRWKADMMSDSWLSKNTRPIIVLSLLAFLFIIIICDSAIGEKFEVKAAYIDLMSTLLVTTIVAYFSSRGIEKYKALHEMKNN